MDKCGHHNNRHYYFPVKIAIYYNFILNFCHNYTDKEGPVMTTPTREELIIMYFFKGYPYKLIVEFLVSIHGIVLSKRQLKRILKSMGLRRKGPQIPLFNQVLRSLVQVSCKVLPLNMIFAIRTYLTHRGSWGGLEAC